MWYLILTFFIHGGERVDTRSLDDLYRQARYQEYLDESRELLRTQPQLRSNYEFLLKIANSCFHLGKYDISEHVYTLAEARDSVLQDYIDFQRLRMRLEQADTIGFMTGFMPFIDTHTTSTALRRELLNFASDLAITRKDTNTFRYILQSYSNPSSIPVRLRYLESRIDADSTLNDLISLAAFLNTSSQSIWTDVIRDIDAHPQRAKLPDSIVYLRLRRLADLDRWPADFQTQYQQVGQYDRNGQLNLDYLMMKKRYSDALNLLIAYQKSGAELTLNQSRLLPRLYIRLNQDRRADVEYLNFARRFPDHSFALDAVTFVMGRTVRNPTEHQRILNEFAEQDSRFRDYYRFRRVLYFYEKQDLITAEKLIYWYMPKASTPWRRDRFRFWLAKIQFERDARLEGFRTLRQLAKSPLRNYYTIKSYVALLQNGEVDFNLPVVDIRQFEIQSDTVASDHVRRLNLILNVYGKRAFIQEFRHVDLRLNERNDYEYLISTLQSSGLYHLAYRYSVRYNKKYRRSERLDERKDVVNHLFPDYYSDLIEARSQQYNVDDDLVSAIVYRESAFQADAVSTANAHGLMQLLPGTAKQLSRRLNVDYNHVYDLYKPETNITLGSYYIKNLLTYFNNDMEYALASYNAGLSRVKRWRKKYPVSNSELFIERIPFEQTRTYVKKVMYAYYAYKLIEGETDQLYYSGIKARK